METAGKLRCTTVECPERPMTSGKETMGICCPRELTYPKNKTLKWEPVLDHPLKPMVVTMTDSRVTRKTVGGSTASSTGSSTPSLDPVSYALDGSDPLNLFAKQQDMDPLSKMAIMETWDSAASFST